MKRSLGKIKRHKSIYSKSYTRFDPLKVIVGSAAVILLFGLGWVLYNPIYHLLAGNLTIPTPSHQEQGEPSLSEEAPEDPDSNSQADEPAIPASAVRGAYLPHSIVVDEVQLSSTLDNLKAKGFTSVLIDLKASNGLLLYNSRNELAASLGAVSSTAIEGRKVAALIREKGLEPMARLSAFQDPLASINRLEMAVHYQDSEWAWLDNSQQNGGKAWLNPYSEEAQDYISDLCLETASLGFDRIVLTGLQFPQGYSLELAGYGPEAAAKEKSQVLKEFSDTLREELAKKETALYIYGDGAALLSGNSAFLGENPWACLENGAAIGAMPSLFGIAFDIVEGDKTTSMESPVTHPETTVNTVAIHVKSHLAPQADALLFLQAYTSLDFTGVNFLEYTQTQIDQQIKGLQRAGINSYILYNPTGIY